MRGLKHENVIRYFSVFFVAPFVGAWIETCVLSCGSPQSRSHPLWVRGLKHIEPAPPVPGDLSHPLWVRGLKLFHYHAQWVVIRVAPFVGAWIETRMGRGTGQAADGRTLCGCVD